MDVSLQTYFIRYLVVDAVAFKNIKAEYYEVSYFYKTEYIDRGSFRLKEFEMRMVNSIYD